MAYASNNVEETLDELFGLSDDENNNFLNSSPTNTVNLYSEEYEFSIVPNDDNNNNLTETMAQLQLPEANEAEVSGEENEVEVTVDTPFTFIKNTKGNDDLLVQNFILSRHRINKTGTVNC